MTPEYDLNEQHRLMRTCEAEAEKTEIKESTVKSMSKKVEQKFVAAEKRVVVMAKEKVDATKSKLQKIVAKCSPKRLQNNGEKEKSKI